MSFKDEMSRRQFNLAMALLGGATLYPGTALAKGGGKKTKGGGKKAKVDGKRAGADGKKTRVVLVRDEKVLDDKGQPREKVLQQMLDSAVAALTGKKGLDGYKTFLKPGDVVGIKTNHWRYLHTPKALEAALRRRVLEVGVKSKNLAVADHGILEHPVFRRSTALINVRPMRTHHWAGVGSLIKNYIIFSPEPWTYHDDSCADLAKVWRLPIVKGKTRLNVLVMLTPQFHGVGPQNFNPKYVWRYHGLIIGFDPVACDSVGLRIIEAKRRAYFGEHRPLATSAKHIGLSDTRHHLGTADPARIELVRLGYSKDSLI